MRDVKELDEAQALTRQRHEWAVQRTGWVLMALWLAAGALGLLGGGGLLGATTTGDEGAPIWIVHERLARLETPTTLRVHLTAEQSDGEVSFWVGADYLEHVEVRQIMPQPASSRAEPERVVYTLDATATERPIVVALIVQPDDPGLLRGEIGRPGGPSIRLTQMVMP